MEVGYYVNLFVVNLQSDVLKVVQDDRAKYPSLKELKERMTHSYLYADGDRIYGYGPNLSELRQLGFTDVQKATTEVPGLTSRMILEGFCEKLKSLGFSVIWRKVRTEAFDTNNPISLSIPEIKLFKGCGLRSVYLGNPEGNIIFGLIVDLSFKIEMPTPDLPGSVYAVRRLVADKYGIEKAPGVIREIKVKFGDLTPYGRRNAEASKFRLNEILGILERITNGFPLPSGITATIDKTPTRIVLEG